MKLSILKKSIASITILLLIIYIGCNRLNEEISGPKIDNTEKWLTVTSGEVGLPEKMFIECRNEGIISEYQEKAKTITEVFKRNYEKIIAIPGVDGMGSTFLKDGRIAFIVTINQSINKQKIPYIIEGIPVILNTGDLNLFYMIRYDRKISETDIKETKKIIETQTNSRSISGAYSQYSNSCICGNKYDNNCAHFLTNAFMNSGDVINTGISTRCPSSRPIRAKEVLTWAQSIKQEFYTDHNSITSGYWFVYQERSDGQAHVCIHLETPTSWIAKGTGDYYNWPVQWHYRW